MNTPGLPPGLPPGLVIAHPSDIPIDGISKILKRVSEFMDSATRLLAASAILIEKMGENPNITIKDSILEVLTPIIDKSFTLYDDADKLGTLVELLHGCDFLHDEHKRMIVSIIFPKLVVNHAKEKTIVKSKRKVVEV